MRIGAIPINEVNEEGGRLTGGFHLSEDQRAVASVKRTPLRREPLASLAREGQIFRGPIFSRRYVNDPAHGEPYVSAKDLIRAEVRPSAYLARSHGDLLDLLRLREGMILITCSGMNLGRVIWVRPDLDGLVGSHDLIRIWPDTARIPPGYLYAFLAGRYGYSQIRKQIYGGHIKHIEPQQIFALQVPRLGDQAESIVSEQIVESAKLIARYRALVGEATDRLFASVGLTDGTGVSWRASGSDLSFLVQYPRHDSLRALNFNPRFETLKNQILAGPSKRLGEICVPGTLTRGGRFKRVDADPAYSLRLIGQRHLFSLQPEGRWVARAVIGSALTVDAGTVLVAARGTLGESELYCRAEFAWGQGLKLAYSEDILRVKADEDVMLRGCLFAFLRSEAAFRMLRSISVGSKLQDHHHIFRAEIPVPYPSRNVQQQIHDLIVEGYECRHRGVALEVDARSHVERAIEEA